jgi:hypothetical protein
VAGKSIALFSHAHERLEAQAITTRQIAISNANLCTAFNKLPAAMQRIIHAVLPAHRGYRHAPILQVRAASLCGIIGGLIVTATIATHADRNLLSVFVENRRPPNLRMTVSEAEPAICDPILQSLNKEYQISDQNLDANPRAQRAIGSASHLGFASPLNAIAGAGILPPA